MKIPNVDFAIIGGSGTLSSNFPKNFADVEILAENLFFDTPYGKSPAFRLCNVVGKKFLTCKNEVCRRCNYQQTYDSSFKENYKKFRQVYRNFGAENKSADFRQIN